MKKYDRFGFEVLEWQSPFDNTSIDDDYGDTDEYERPWYEEEDVCYDEVMYND